MKKRSFLVPVGVAVAALTPRVATDGTEPSLAAPEDGDHIAGPSPAFQRPARRGFRPLYASQRKSGDWVLLAAHSSP